MKTKELIRLLNIEDPSGDMEVCVENIDIFYIETLPSYYDGPQEILIRDSKLEPYYDITGGIINYKGKKIVIKTLSLESVVFEDPTAPIEIKGIGDKSRIRKKINKWKEESLKWQKTKKEMK